MKKSLTVLGICFIFLMMPAISAISNPISKSIDSKIPNSNKKIVPTVDEFDGYFTGAYGLLFKQNDEWDFEEYGYIAGIYIDGKQGKLYGNIYDLDENLIGTFSVFFGRGFFIGQIQNEKGKAPIVGFLFFNEEYFLGRIMSFFGPVPHVIGKHWVSEE